MSSAARAGTSAQATTSAGPGKTAAVQGQVDEVIGIMNNNIEKVMARGERLETLQNKTDDLQQGAMQFKRGATKVRREMCVSLLCVWVGVVVMSDAHDSSLGCLLSPSFKQSTKKDRWLKDLKLKLIIAGVIILVLVVIIVPIALTFRNQQQQQNGSQPANSPR
jgi:vesicle-associated membrane protein 4